MKKFDLIIIGSGSGLEVSSESINRGLKVAVIDNGPFGGTCLNRGCIPSKMLIHCADVMRTIRSSRKFGIEARVEHVDWKFIIDRVSREVDAESAEIEHGNKELQNMTIYKGTARFIGKKSLKINNETVSAENIVIAAGSRPIVLDIPGLKNVPYFTSDNVMRLKKRPEHMIILGGGYIAAELAHFFGTFGTKITIIQRSDLLLSHEDYDISEKFTEIFQRDYEVHLGTKVIRAFTSGTSAGVEILAGHKKQTVVGDILLLATGRMANTDILDVHKAGVEVDDNGSIVVDKHMQTTQKGIWALGDIVGKYQLKHSANLEAAYVTNNIFNPRSRVAIDYHAMPHAIFAYPQVGSVGITEQEAKKRKIPYLASTHQYKDTAYGSSIEDGDGFVKVLVNRHTGEILGCHIIGTDASTLVQEVANAMRNDLTFEAIKQSIYIHPALPEVVQRAFAGLDIRLN